MVWVIAISVGAVLLIAMAAFFFRSHQADVQQGFQLLQSSFAGLQRTYEERATALRTELSDQLSNNRKELQLGLTQTTLTLEQKVLGMDNKLDFRLKELTVGVQDKLEKNLKEGFVHFEKVQQHLKQAEVQLQNLNSVGQSINDLNNLLKLPHLRGSFGEATLERLLSDLLPVEAFELQYRVVPHSTERVDAVVKCPQYVLPIDSKFPREQVLPLFESNDPGELEAARKQLSEVIRSLGKQIREKYIHPEYGTTDMALLFVPSETLYFELLRNIRLCEELGKYRVFPVSPNTLAVTLHAIAISRSYYEMAKGVETTILEVKKGRQHFENFERRFEEIGKSLGRANDAFGTASTHLSRYSSAVNRLTGNDAPLEKILPPEINA